MTISCDVTKVAMEKINIESLPVVKVMVIQWIARAMIAMLKATERSSRGKNVEQKLGEQFSGI